MKTILKAAALLTLAAPASVSIAQFSGVSHPEDVPITTSPEGIAQPVVYTPTPSSVAAVPVLKPRAAEPQAQPAQQAQPNYAPRLLPASSALDPKQSALADDELATTDQGSLRALSLASEADAGVVTHIDGPANQLPAGTLLKIRMQRELTTKTAVGTPFTGELVEPVLRDGQVLLPAGAVVAGKVSEVHGGRRITGSASIHLRPDTITLPDGTVYPLHAQVIDTDLFHATKVDHEGTIQRKDQALKTAGAFALSTGSGAAAGAVFGGWPGALIGAGIGAGVSTVVWLKQDRQAELPAGTKVILALNLPLECGAQ